MAQPVAALVVKVAADLAELKGGVQQIGSTLDGLGATATKLGGVLAGAFSVHAIVGAIQRTAEWAGQISDLSNRLGISAEAVQRLDFAAQQNGSSINQVAIAMGQLARNVVGGNDSAEAALNRLGLSLAELRGLSPDELFRRVGAAIAELPDRTQRLATAQQLLGRSGAELIPLLENLDRDMSRAAVASDEAIKAGDQLADTWDRLKGSGTALLANVFVPFGPELEQFDQAVTRVIGRMQELSELRKFGAPELSIGPVSSAAGVGGSLFDAILGQLDMGPRAEAALAKQINEVATAAEKAAQGVGAYQQAARLSTTSVDEATAATARMYEQLKVTTAELQIQTRLTGEDMVEKATALLAALEGLEARGLRPTAAGWREIAATATDALDVMRNTGNAADGLVGQLEQLRTLAAAFTAPDLKPLAIAGLPYSDTAAEIQALERYGALAAERLKAEQEWDQVLRDSIAIADENARAIEAGLQAQVSATAAVSAGYRDTAAAAREAAAAIQVLVPLGTSITEAYLNAGFFVNDAASIRPGPGVRRSPSSIPSFAGGTDGYEYFGGGTLAMLHGWEQVTPKGASGGAGGGSPVVVNIDARESMMDTPASLQRLADRVSRAVVSQLQGQAFGVA